MSKPYEIYTNKKQSLIMLLITGLACACALYMLFYTADKPMASIKWGLVFNTNHQAMTAILALFLPLAILFLNNFFNTRPVITIDARGISDSRNVKLPIPWHAVLRGRQDILKMGRHKYPLLILELADFETSKVKFTMFYHVNKMQYKSKKPNVIVLPLVGLKYDANELSKALFTHKFGKVPSNLQMALYGQGKVLG